jgi:hypothetical protein
MQRASLKKSSKESCFHKRSKFFIAKRDVKSGTFFLFKFNAGLRRKILNFPGWQPVIPTPAQFRCYRRQWFLSSAAHI